MKNSCWSKYIIFAFIIGLFLTCKISIEDTDLRQKPDVNISDKQVTIIIPKINNDTDYITICRKNGSTKTNVGIIFPKDYSTNDANYVFIDKLVYKDQKYQYQVRYHDSKENNYSQWSNEIEIKNVDGALDTESVSFDIGSEKFVYDSTNNTLALSDGINAPDFPAYADASTEFKTMIVISIKNTNTRQIFELPDNFIAGNNPINMLEKLPQSFYDKELVLEGILAQNSKDLNYIEWTELTEIPLQGNVNRTITIPFKSGTNGIDYSF
ncbi:MAG: hypothetical protein J6X84_00475 [Treponema sp.]|nr:hypothetical protein [Treponema sp.]